MKRRAAMLLILLLLVGGAIVNVAVAWGFVWRGARPIIDRTESISQEVYGIWLRCRPPGFPADIDWNQSYTTHSDGLEFALFVNTADPTSLPSLIWQRAGWPLHSLSGGRARIDTPGLPGPTDSSHTINAIQLTGRKVYPLRPFWPGFAVNTVFYASILWLLFAAPFALRRWRRIKRGLCPKCAYPAGTSEVCTECGASLPR